MEIFLDWNGPLIVGQRLPCTQTEVDALRGNGVYLWYREYPNGELVTYIGKTDDIARRFEQWLVQFLTLRCRSRTTDGTVFGDYSPVRFFNYMMSLDESIDIAKSEVCLTRFHYAFTTNITDAEGCLIAGLKERSKNGNSRVVFGQNQPSFDRSTRLRHSFKGIVEPGAQCGNLEYILGE